MYASNIKEFTDCNTLMYFRLSILIKYEHMNFELCWRPAVKLYAY